MSVDRLNPAGGITQPQPFDNMFSTDTKNADAFNNQSVAKQSGGGGINFGMAQPGSSSLNFGDLSQKSNAVQNSGDATNAQSSGSELNQQTTQLLNEVLKIIMQMLQQFNGGSDSDTKGSGSPSTTSGNGSGSPATSSNTNGSASPATDSDINGSGSLATGSGDEASAGNTDEALPSYQEATASPPSYQAATANPPSYQDATASAQPEAAAATGAADADTATAGNTKTAATSAESTASASSASATAASDQVTGSGPRSFDITNAEDHDITLGMFDKDNKQVASMTLKPGEKGTMNYQNDFTGVIKQADADGKFQDSASRLEFYNGFINTSDIDGRNAAISATDHNGFNIGDNKSIADGAPDNIVSTDSAGDKTIAGWYDGSTDTMKAGGEYMENQLGTGDTYIHPNDDQLGQGNNPMRHTDATKVDVTFSKA